MRDKPINIVLITHRDILEELISMIKVMFVQGFIVEGLQIAVVLLAFTIAQMLAYYLEAIRKEIQPTYKIDMLFG